MQVRKVELTLQRLLSIQDMTNPLPSSRLPRAATKSDIHSPPFHPESSPSPRIKRQVSPDPANNTDQPAAVPLELLDYMADADNSVHEDFASVADVDSELDPEDQFMADDPYSGSAKKPRRRPTYAPQHDEPSHSSAWGSMGKSETKATPVLICRFVRDAIAARARALRPAVDAHSRPVPTGNSILSSDAQNQLNWYKLGNAVEIIHEHARRLDEVEAQLSRQAALNARPTVEELSLLQGCAPELPPSAAFLLGGNSPYGSAFEASPFSSQFRRATSAQSEPAAPLAVTHLPRRRRFVGVAIGVAAVAAVGATGTFLGLYNTIQLGMLQAEVRSQGRIMKALVHHVNDIDVLLSRHGSAINALQAWVTAEAIYTTAMIKDVQKTQLIAACVDAIHEMGEDYLAITSALMHHRLSLHAISEPSLRDALANFSATADSLGFGLLVNSVSDALQCEASFAATKEGLDIFLHVPLAGIDDHLALYQHLEVPVQVTDDVFMTFRPSQDLLAISRDEGRFKQMSMGQLTQCSKLGQIYLCPHENVVRKAHSLRSSDPSACLFFLFKQDYGRINDSCPIHLLGPTDAAAAILSTEFLLSSRTRHVGKVTCPDGSSTRFSAEHVTRVVVPPGCRADTDSWTASAALDLTVQARTIVFGWAGDLSALLRHIDLAAYSRLRAKLPFSPVPVESRQAAEWTQAQLDVEQLGVFASGSSLKSVVALAFAVVGVLLALAVAAIITFLWCRRCRNRPQAPLQLQARAPPHEDIYVPKEHTRFLAVA